MLGSESKQIKNVEENRATFYAGTDGHPVFDP